MKTTALIRAPFIADQSTTSRVPTASLVVEHAVAEYVLLPNEEDWENRMIKVNVMYPYTEGARFDHAYYRDRHMPMDKARLGSACAYYTIEKGLAGRAPGAPPAFVAMCAFICDSLEGYQAATQEHGAEIRADIANYTDITPVIQFSEVVVERSDG